MNCDIDEKRNRLYNAVFRRHFKDIEPIFEITGIIKDRKETYSPEKYYERFELKLKLT